MAAGEEDKIVEQICDVSMISSDSSPSDYDCDGEMSSRSSASLLSPCQPAIAVPYDLKYRLYSSQ